MGSKGRLKDECCKSFKGKGKACKRCPLVASASVKSLRALAQKIKKKKAYNEFCERYGV